MPEKDVTPENIQLVNDIMTKTVKLSVPLKSDTVIMTEWMEEIKPEDWFNRR
jgi:DNA polymerase I